MTAAVQRHKEPASAREADRPECKTTASKTISSKSSSRNRPRIGGGYRRTKRSAPERTANARRFARIPSAFEFKSAALDSAVPTSGNRSSSSAISPRTIPTNSRSGVESGLVHAHSRGRGSAPVRRRGGVTARIASGFDAADFSSQCQHAVAADDLRRGRDRAWAVVPELLLSSVAVPDPGACGSPSAGAVLSRAPRERPGN